MPMRQTDSKSQKSSPARKKPGSTGKGEYYHIEVGSKGDFVTYRTQDVGRPGHIQRVAGKRPSGYWSTVKWLIDKDEAHVQGNKLIPDSRAARQVIEQLGSDPVRMVGDRFKASPRAERTAGSPKSPTPAKSKKTRPSRKQSS